jgi:hypothetical protein
VQGDDERVAPPRVHPRRNVQTELRELPISRRAVGSSHGTCLTFVGIPLAFERSRKGVEFACVAFVGLGVHVTRGDECREPVAKILDALGRGRTEHRRSDVRQSCRGASKSLTDGMPGRDGPVERASSYLNTKDAFAVLEGRAGNRRQSHVKVDRSPVVARDLPQVHVENGLRIGRAP